VATHAGCGAILDNRFTANLRRNLTEKTGKNQLTFDNNNNNNNDRLTAFDPGQPG